MKLSELFTEKYEMYAKLYDATAETFDTIRRKRGAGRYDFFACLNRLTGQKCMDNPKRMADRKEMTVFAKSVGNTLRYGAVLWFCSRFRDGFIIVDFDNWKRVYSLLVPSQPLTEAEKDVRMVELANKSADKLRKMMRPANEIFADAQPDRPYRKMGKRGFRADFDRDRHENEIATFDRKMYRQGKGMGITVRVRYHGAEDARFAERLAKRDANR